MLPEPTNAKAAVVQYGFCSSLWVAHYVQAMQHSDMDAILHHCYFLIGAFVSPEACWEVMLLSSANSGNGPMDAHTLSGLTCLVEGAALRDEDRKCSSHMQDLLHKVEKIAEAALLSTDTLLPALGQQLRQAVLLHKTTS